jgi:hypothetical protein
MPVYAGRALIGAAIAAFIGLSAVVTPILTQPAADMRLSPADGLFILNEPVTITVVVEADVPTNVFSGELVFDSATLAVEQIDYNTSLADLWAVEPWYSRGDGTIIFAGGTTEPGGFTGTDTLLTVTFRPITTGAIQLGLENIHILRHDGLGSEVAVSDRPIDAVLEVEIAAPSERTVLAESQAPKRFAIVPETPNTDLNADGVTDFRDVSAFMVRLITQDASADFTGDGTVDTRDLSIIVAASRD